MNRGTRKTFTQWQKLGCSKDPAALIDRTRRSYWYFALIVCLNGGFFAAIFPSFAQFIVGLTSGTVLGILVLMEIRLRYLKEDWLVWKSVINWKALEEKLKEP